METVVGYTRAGRKLHAVKLQEGRRIGQTVCGKVGYRHPHFTGSPAQLSLGLNGGCRRCLERL